MTTPSIVELSARIAANTAKVEQYLTSRGLPLPSFSVDTPLDGLIGSDAPDIQAARREVIHDTMELHRLMLATAPKEYAMSFWPVDYLGLHAIIRFRLAHAVPVGGEATFAEMDAASGGVLGENALRQLVRQAISKNVFCEPRPGVVAHNSISRLLAEDDKMADYVGVLHDEVWQASSQACNALDKYRKSEEANEAGFNLANNTTKTVHELFNDFPERARRFANCMQAMAGTNGWELDHVIAGFPWASLPTNATLVDVGGSKGHACHALARRFSGLGRLVVQDTPPVVEQARGDSPADLAATGRIEYMAHDFFTAQPVAGADVYLYRQILHNWPDKYAVRILQALVPALRAGSRVVLVDHVFPEPGSVPRWEEERIRTMDLLLRSMHNSYIRELRDWEAVFARADKRFRFRGGVQPEGSNQYVMVIDWEP